jgi:hypothetical protein
MAVDRGVSCRQLSASVIETTVNRNGSSMGTAHWEISGSGRVLKIKSTSLDSHGLAKSKEREYARVSGSAGFSGEWEDARPFASQPSLLELRLSGHVLRYAFPEIGQYADSALDGSDATVHGPGVPLGLRMAFTVGLCTKSDRLLRA